MFITTANNRHQIPLPLQDRLEIIELPSYTAMDKAKICKEYLIPKQMTKHGLSGAEINVASWCYRIPH